MKKIVLLLCTLVCLTGCTNMQFVDTAWNFDHARLTSANKCVKVKSWKDFEDSDMIQITLESGVTLMGYSSEIVLIDRSKGSCPYCGN